MDFIRIYGDDRARRSGPGLSLVTENLHSLFDDAQGIFIMGMTVVGEVFEVGFKEGYPFHLLCLPDGEILFGSFTHRLIISQEDRFVISRFPRFPGREWRIRK